MASASTPSSVAASARGIAGEAADAATSAAFRTAQAAQETIAAGKGVARHAAQSAPGIAATVVGGIKSGPKTISTRTTSAASALHSAAQGVLASDLSEIANALIQSTVKGPASIYDRAMDARFIETGIGGSHHRLFDGGHTISGALAAARDASPEDNIVQESLGAVLGLLRDASTPRGLPLATWNQETFNQVAGTLESSFHIPKSWFADLNTYTGDELLGGTIGVLAVIFSWNRADTESFAKLAGGIGVSSALSANPLLMLVTLVAMGRAYQKARRTDEMAEFVDGQFRGGLVAGASFAAISAVAVGGGPAGLALLVAIVAGILVNVATKRVSVVQIGRVVRDLAAAVVAQHGSRDGSERAAGSLVQPAD